MKTELNPFWSTGILWKKTNLITNFVTLTVHGALINHPANYPQPNPSLCHQHIPAPPPLSLASPHETDDLYIPVRLVSFGVKNRRVGGYCLRPFLTGPLFKSPSACQSDNSYNLACSSRGFTTWLEPVSDSLIASNRPSINKDTTGNYHVGFDYVGVWTVVQTVGHRQQLTEPRNL